MTNKFLIKSSNAIVFKMADCTLQKLSRITRKLTFIQWCIPNITNLRYTYQFTVKPVLNGRLKIGKTKVLLENGSLMKVESIALCSPWSTLQYFWIGIDHQF